MKNNLKVNDWVVVSGYSSGGQNIDGCKGKYQGLLQSGNVSVRISHNQTKFSQEIFFVRPSQVKKIADNGEEIPFLD